MPSRAFIKIGGRACPCQATRKNLTRTSSEDPRYKKDTDMILFIDRTRCFYPGGNMTLYEQVTEAVASIHARTTLKPAIALILGSGLGDIATELHDATSIPYTE